MRKINLKEANVIEWMMIHQKSFLVLFINIINSNIKNFNFPIKIYFSNCINIIISVLNYLFFKEKLFYCFFLKKYSINYFIDYYLNKKEKILFNTNIIFFFFKNGFLKNFSKIIFWVKNLLKFTNSTCIKQVQFLTINQIEKLILKDKILLIWLFFYLHFIFSNAQYKETNKNIYKNVKKKIKKNFILRNTKKKVNFLFNLLTLKNNLFMKHIFYKKKKSILSCIIFRIYKYHIFFILRIKFYFLFMWIKYKFNKKKIFKKKYFFIDFFSSFFFCYKLKNSNHFILRNFLRNLSKTIIYIEKKNIKISFELGRKKNDEKTIDEIGLYIKSICNYIITKKFMKNLVFYLFFLNFEYFKNSSIYNKKKLKFFNLKNSFQKEIKFVYFYFRLNVFWKNKKKIVSKKLYKMVFYDYLFKIKKLFPICYANNVYFFINIITLTNILKRVGIKKAIINYFFLSLDSVIKDKNSHILYIVKNSKFSILKEIVRILIGKNILKKLRNIYLLNRLIIFLHKSLKKIQLLILLKKKIFIILKTFNENALKYVNFINKFSYEFMHFLFISIFQITLRFRSNSYLESKKDIVSYIHSNTNLIVFDPITFDKIKKTKFYLPISIYRCFRVVSKIYFFQKKKKGEIMWNFDFTKFLIKSIGILCNQKKLVFFYTNFFQMLIIIAFNEFFILFKKELKLLILSFNNSINFGKNEFLKLYFSNLFKEKKSKNLEFLIINRFFYPKAVVNKLPVFSINLQSLKNIFFSSQTTFLQNDYIYICQVFIIRVAKNVNKISCNKLLNKIRNFILKYFISDPRGIKIQIEELKKKEYIELSKRKKLCKYLFI